MTTIRTLSQSITRSGKVPEVGARILAAVVTAGVLVGIGLFAIQTLSFEDDIGAALSRATTERLDALRPQFSCDVSGAAVEIGPTNCLDYRGFRVRREGGYRIYSLRYSTPLFVFGIRNGIVYGNQKIDRSLQAAEQSAFNTYFTGG